MTCPKTWQTSEEMQIWQWWSEKQASIFSHGGTETKSLNGEHKCNTKLKKP